MEDSQARNPGLELRSWDDGRCEAADTPHKHEKSFLQRAQDKLLQTLPTFSSVDINDLKLR
ncbi:MAG: hypothetical protein EBZ48_17280, partial [Proteobacteria bacterium]|nr:hypothetical protein [Pseudomonadota bacterium]